MPDNAPSILVTGATGFVGRRLIRQLVERYGAASILCLAFDQAEDPLEISGRAILDELGVRYVPIELVSGRGLDAVPRSPKLVFHLASNTDTGSSDHRVNDVGMRNLLDAVTPLAPGGRFLFTSTIAVSDHRADMDAPVTEETPLLRPFNDYGRRKLAAEALLRQRARQDGFQATILRLSAVFGEGTRQQGLYDQLAIMTLKGSPLARLDFPGMLSFIAAEDIARTLIRLADEPTQAGTSELYIPIAETMSIADLIKLYHEAAGKPYRPIRLPRAFWKLCNFATRCLFRIEPLLPHALNNRIWQVGLVVGNGFHNRTDAIQRRFPDLAFRRVRDALPGMLRKYRQP